MEFKIEAKTFVQALEECAFIYKRTKRDDLKPIVTMETLVGEGTVLLKTYDPETGNGFNCYVQCEVAEHEKVSTRSDVLIDWLNAGWDKRIGSSNRNKISLKSSLCGTVLHIKALNQDSELELFNLKSLEFESIKVAPKPEANFTIDSWALNRSVNYILNCSHSDATFYFYRPNRKRTLQLVSVENGRTSVASMYLLPQMKMQLQTPIVVTRGFLGALQVLFSQAHHETKITFQPGEVIVHFNRNGYSSTFRMTSIHNRENDGIEKIKFNPDVKTIKIRCNDMGQLSNALDRLSAVIWTPLENPTMIMKIKGVVLHMECLGIPNIAKELLPIERFVCNGGRVITVYLNHMKEAIQAIESLDIPSGRENDNQGNLYIRGLTNGKEVLHISDAKDYYSSSQFHYESFLDIL